MIPSATSCYLPVFACLFLSVTHPECSWRAEICVSASLCPYHLDQSQSTSLEGSQEAGKNLVKYYLRKNMSTLCSGQPKPEGHGSLQTKALLCQV